MDLKYTTDSGPQFYLGTPMEEAGLALKSEYAAKLGQGLVLSPGLTHARATMDGAANRYDGYGANVSLKRFSPRYFFLAALSYKRNQYDEAHPIFNKTREETVWGGFALLTWFNPFDLDHWFASASLGYFHSEANIDFFDATTIISLVSAGHKFQFLKSVSEVAAAYQQSQLYNGFQGRPST